MTYRCALCGRAMRQPAVLIGQMGVGPKCARRANLLEPARKRLGILMLVKGRAQRSEDGQMDLELEVAA
jgi:hypothetical protein